MPGVQRSKTRHSTETPAWQGRLRAKGYRLTPQRQLVLEAIAELGHATPEEIINYVRDVASGVNISTVYRTLDLLEELSLVTHTHLGHGAPTYHVAENSAHVHLVCRDCGAVTEIPSQAVEPLLDRLESDYGFVADVHHFAIFGRCVSCRDAIGKA
ncbi:MAG: transcriptional repressor [Acidothermus sp.]|nr:transcriptional repressor [Acidothermus sp.]MCL6537284.1 transcriptional repressor [Acidothermus sp.]